MDILSLIVGIFGGALFSWLITHFYYKRSLLEKREHIEKEILIGKLSDYHRVLARMGDNYLNSSDSDREDISDFIKANARDILEILGHHVGFVNNMLKDHSDEIDFSTIERLDSKMYALWYKYW